MNNKQKGTEDPIDGTRVAMICDAIFWHRYPYYAMLIAVYGTQFETRDERRPLS